MRYVAALDVGTTTVRCHILDENAVSASSATEKVDLLYPEPGYVEIDPEQLWAAILKVIKTAVRDSGIDARSIACLGISTQRNSLITWNLSNGKPYHRFITWKDLRADNLVNEWNASITMKGIRAGSRILYTLSRSRRFLAGSVFKFMNTQITLRLLWALQHVPGLREAAHNGTAVFGCVDCWLLYKLTGKHITDVSSASATGLFDPFTMGWAGWAMHLLKLPRTMFPEVVNTAMNFGLTPKDILGVEIPILCSMADQAASLFGSGCFNPGDLKATMGTGSFVNVNTGTEPHASVTGLYPLVAWQIDNELVYMVEGASNDTGILVEWAKFLGIITEDSDTTTLVHTVNDSDGVYFIPAFSGLQAPINDHTAAAGFLGIKPTTGKAHLVRALLESIVFRILLLYQSLCTETRFTYKKICVDGGVSKNDFVMQLLADVTKLEVERATTAEISTLGVAFLAGLRCGIWKSKEDLYKFRHIGKVFKPNAESHARYQNTFNQWKRAINRFKDWY